jgi:glucoamylase
MYLDTMARSADDATHFLAEQVWDRRAPANTGSPAIRPGENTFSATPLAWSHAQFIRLARNIDAGTPVETPRVVACRYVQSCGSVGRGATPAPAGGAAGQVR